jgi:hypothetical protein
MTKKKLNIFDHIFLWLKTILRYFKDHKIQGRIFWFNITFAVCLWSIIMGFYMGEGIKELISNLYNCK